VSQEQSYQQKVDKLLINTLFPVYKFQFSRIFQLLFVERALQIINNLP